MATTEPQKWSATLGASADVNSLPATTPAGSGRASTSGLFPQVTQKPLDEGGIAPERADFNALFKYLGDYIYYVMQGGVFSYLSTYAYTAGNLAMFSGAVYECIAANGPGNVHAPTDTAYWRKLATLQDIPPAATVNDGQLTINVNGSQVATFSANQATNETINIDALPIGSYIQFAGSQAPAGFLVCNGGAVSRTTYSKLFAVIGTTYGGGDGWSTFNLPNLTDRFLQGNTTVGAVRNAGLPNITGSASELYGVTPSISASGAMYQVYLRDDDLHGADDSYKQCNFALGFDASRSSAVYGRSSTVQPNAITCLICIKY